MLIKELTFIILKIVKNVRKYTKSQKNQKAILKFQDQYFVIKTLV